MSENIAGYIDKKYVKGQYYRTAGCPKPIVFTGDIDAISDSLLVKAMFVTKGTVEGGTFPKDEVDTYLITTVEYGNVTYLQTAISSSSGYEYRRIYAGGTWSNWLEVDSRFDSIEGTLSDLSTTVGTHTSTLDSQGSSISSILTRLSSDESTIRNISTTTSSWDGKIKTVDTKVSNIASVFGPKVYIVSSTYSGGGYKEGSGWLSHEATVNIKNLGLKSVIAVIPGMQRGSDGGYGGWTYLKVFNTEKIVYQIARLTVPGANLKNRVEKFIIIGT